MCLLQWQCIVVPVSLKKVFEVDPIQIVNGTLFSVKIYGLLFNQFSAFILNDKSYYLYYCIVRL